MVMMNMKIKMIKLSDGDVLGSISQAEKQWRLYFSSITDKFVIKNKQFLATSKCGSPVYIVIKKQNLALDLLTLFSKIRSMVFYLVPNDAFLHFVCLCDTFNTQQELTI